MKTDRRSFLQHFGIGASIVPLIGGIPAIQAEAKLIEVPKLDLSGEMPQSGDDPFQLLKNPPIGVYLCLRANTGLNFHFMGKTAMLEIKRTPLDFDYPYPSAFPAQTHEWRFRGRMIEPFEASFDPPTSGQDR